MKRSFHLALARPPRSFPLKTMPILRLPTVLFPDQKMALPLADSRSEALPSSSASYAAFGPGALVGVELSQLTAAPCREQLLVGGSRVRLIRSRPSHDKTAIVGVLQRVVDVSMTPERAARLSDEAQWARQLASLAVEKQYLHMPQPAEMTTELMDASTLSLWLAARLPLAPKLLAQLIASTCPLTRMRDVVDAMRLLCEPSPRRERPTHRLKLRERAGSGALEVEQAARA